MAAPTSYYVDPSIAADSGSGTIGDPYGDLQYALNQITRDSTNGDQINIKAGTDEILGSALTLATYGTATYQSPLILRGYTSAENDGGTGGISGNGSVSITGGGGTWTNVFFIDLHLHNCGSAVICPGLSARCIFFNCELDNTTGSGIVGISSSRVLFCHLHNLGAHGMNAGSSNVVAFCTFENGTNDFTNCILSTGSDLVILFNVFDVDGSTNVINVKHGAFVLGNSIYSNAGTGTAIRATDGNNASLTGAVALGNIIEGFSGVGGTAYEDFALAQFYMLGYNALYNNTTTGPANDNGYIDETGSDQALGSSPFTDASTDDFTVDTSVKALAFPTANYPSLSVRSYLDMGALQREEPAGGGVGQRPIFRGFTHLG